MARKTTACPKCSTELDISSFKPGQRIRCGACNTVLRIPGGEPAPAPVPAPVGGGGGGTATRRAPSPAPTPAPAPPPAEEKDTLVGYPVGGEFEIVRKLGEGGYGAVYEAVDKTLRRKVAVKLMLASRASNKEYVAKFLREARTAAQLSHPNVVAIHQVGYDKGQKTHYLAMEYVEGRTLHDILQERGPLDLEECVDIISQCCRGLEPAHRKNIIHRDIKPGNIMITPSKGVKIADFGLAKVFDAEEQAKSMVIGTPFFMPPEQFEGKAKDGRTDIYALGVTLYYMLTLKRPFTGSTPAQILVNIMTKDPTPVTEYRAEIPDSAWQVVRRMIHRDLDQRYQDCGQILEDLEALRRPEEGEKVYCPECGVPNPEDAEKCKGCGASMREKCPLCGAEEDIGVKFCGDCGANIPAEKEVKALADEGRALLDAGDFMAAIDKLRKAKERSPENGAVVTLLREAENRRDHLEGERTGVNALLARGEYDRAEERLKSALEEYPDDEMLLALQGDLERSRKASSSGQGRSTVQALLKARRYGEAREAAERLMMSEGRTPELVELLRQAEDTLRAIEDKTKQARAADESGARSAALAAWREVLEVHPDHAEARERTERIEEAIGAVDALVETAVRLLEAGNPEEAVQRLSEAGVRATDEPRVQETLDRALDAAEELRKGAAGVREHVEGGALDRAADSLASLSEKFPGAGTLSELETSLREARKAADREERVERIRALVAERKWSEVRDLAAEILGEEEVPEVAEAEEQARSALARAAELISRATEAEAAGRFAEAEEAFGEAVELAPEQGDAAEGRKRAGAARERIEGLTGEAAAARDSGDLSRAVALLREARGVSPGDGEVARTLAELEERIAGRLRGLREIEELLASGEVDGARTRARDFAKEHADDGEAKEVLAITEHLLGARDEILRRVERLLAAEGREREAAKLAQVALRILPGDSRAAALLAKAREGDGARG